METRKKTIVVFGCTGTVGKVVFDNLLDHNCHVRGILRHPERLPPIPLDTDHRHSYLSADLTQPKDLEAACAYADAVFLLTATHPQQVQNEINVINAAKACGIKRLVKLSAPMVEPVELVEVAKWHREIENYLESSGLDYCCLRPQAFMQNWERNTFTIRRFGKIYGAMQDAPRNYIDARDVAEVAVKLLLKNTPSITKYIPLSGPEAITNYDMAERLSKVTQSTIRYVDMTPAALLKLLKTKAKLPEWLAKHIVELDELAVKIPEPTHDSIEKLLNRKPRLMNAYLQESKHHFKRQSIWKI